MGRCTPHPPFMAGAFGRFTAMTNNPSPQFEDPRLPQSFWDRVEPEPNTGCWLWMSYTSDGYGRTTISGKFKLTHRIAFEAIFGPVPDGLVLDHLCRVRSCVNPSHLEIVTHRENILRGEGLAAKAAVRDTCARGHSLSDAPTRRDGRSRICRECSNRRNREYRKRKSADFA